MENHGLIETDIEKLDITIIEKAHYLIKETSDKIASLQGTTKLALHNYILYDWRRKNG